MSNKILKFTLNWGYTVGLLILIGGMLFAVYGNKEAVVSKQTTIESVQLSR